MKTEEVEGVVKLDGQPVPDAQVTFVPVKDGVGLPATGMTNSEGKYRLTAQGSGDRGQAGAGTLPGEYYVGVVKDSIPSIPTSEEAVGPGKTRPSGGELTHVVPQKFNVPQNSGIKQVVKEGKNDIPIELTSK